MSKKILAIIGLRSGSKGLKNKNIKKLSGKPLFAHILDAAKKSKHINRIILSTDSTKYKKIINKCGGETPYMRPKKYSNDDSPEIHFIRDLLNYLKKKEKYVPDIVVRLLATCPFQKTTDIDKAITLVLKNKYQSSVVISKAKQHPGKALKIVGKKKKFVTTYFGNNPLKVGSKLNRQEFPDAYFRSNVLVCKKKVIEKYNSLSSNKTGFVKIPYQIDIDCLEDFKYAEYIIKKI
jgi:CMP-N,N'-diacetyllegionaminic acid synthase|tara:strand:+ start:729 stop:1433 length:705 start_codon:yes stop_codon:yes gene_type:complete